MLLQRDGKLKELEVCSESTINIHIAATALHYGQEAFEGMKAFRGRDGKVRLFRPDENAMHATLQRRHHDGSNARRALLRSD